MYKELSLFGSFLDKDIKNLMFEGLKHNIQGISCSPSDILKIKEFLPEKIKLISMIDYPYGLSGSLSKQNSILESIKHGATDIDLVLNQGLVLNKDITKLKKEIEPIQAICKDKNVNLRVNIECQLLTEKELISLVRSIYNMGIRQFLPSTCIFNSDYSDILILCTTLKKKFADIELIFTGSIWKDTQYKQVVQSKLYGIRLLSPFNLSYLNVGV